MVADTPLHRPLSFFDDPPPWNDHPATLVALSFGTAVALTAVVFGIGHLLAGEFSGTVTVENPAYPGDLLCESGAVPEVSGEGFDERGSDETAFGDEPPGCDEPATVERDASALVLEATREVAGQTFVGYLLAWGLGGLVLHGAAWLAGGEGNVLDTLNVAAWSGVTYVVAAIPGVALVAYGVRTTETAGSDPEAVASALEAALAGLEPVSALLAVVVVTWQAVVWFAGLVARHELDDARAAVVAGVLWFVLVLGSL